MKRIFAFSACFAFLVSAALSSPPEGFYSYSFARLNYVKGDVFVKRAEDLGYEEGVVNLALVEGDKLGTNRGRAEVHLGRQNYLRVNHFTQIDFIRLPQRGDDLVELHLFSGEIFLRVDFLEREKEVEIHTPDASLYILEQGLFRVQVRESRETEFSVYEGSAEVAGEEGSLLLKREEHIRVKDGFFSSDPGYFYASNGDDFASWSRWRDTQHNRTVDRRYLPSELYEYEVELATNGRGVYERPYGYVWVPHVRNYHWRPYFYGRWVWYPIIGWTWLSYESWGWCVYHYGRWHWRVGLGWYWIPTRYWGPAWVHWYRGYDYIGWCPLSYYGHPAVVVNNHFYGRYYGRHYPLHSRALTVVHRRQLQARRISKVALSQGQKARLGKISLSAKQPRVRPVVDRSGAKASTAARALSRSSLRPVNKSYKSGKRLGPSGTRSVRPKISSPRSIKSRKSSSTLSHTVSKRKYTSLGESNRVRNRTSPSRKTLKTYPSRREFAASSSSRGISPYSSQKRPRTSWPRLKSTSRSQRRSLVKSYPSRRSRSNVSRKPSSVYPSPRSSLVPSSRSKPGLRSSSPRFSGSRSRPSPPKISFSSKTHSSRRSPKISSQRSSRSVRRSSSRRVKKK